jgi:hypothetical protein
MMETTTEAAGTEPPLFALVARGNDLSIAVQATAGTDLSFHLRGLGMAGFSGLRHDRAWLLSVCLSVPECSRSCARRLLKLS